MNALYHELTGHPFKKKTSTEERIMKKLVRLAGIPVFIGVLFCYHGAAFAEHTGADKYNNEDLNKYETPGRTDEKTAPQVPDKISSEKKSEDLKTLNQKDWCRRGAPIVSKISEAKKELEETNSNSSAYEGVGEEAKQEKRNNIMRRLTEAESELNDLDNEAHAKGVPTGWIRCNFE